MKANTVPNPKGEHSGYIGTGEPLDYKRVSADCSRTAMKPSLDFHRRVEASVTDSKPFWSRESGYVYRLALSTVIFRLLLLLCLCGSLNGRGAVGPSSTNGIVIGWANDFLPCWSIPPDLSNVVAVASGGCHHWAL